MAKCVRCGKMGLFLHLDLNGHCPECSVAFQEEKREEARLLSIQQKEAALQRLKSIPKHKIALSDVRRKRQTGYGPVKTSNITSDGVYDRFVVFDTETTGLAPSKNRIVELAAIRFVGGEPVQLFTALIDPQREIPHDVSALNGITNEIVAGFPTISQVLPAFEDFIGDDLLIAHNIEFDLKFLFYSGSKMLETKRKYIDTLEQAKKLLKKPKARYFAPDPDDVWDEGGWHYDYNFDYDVDNYKLDTLCDYYGIVRPYEHRAAADALATGDLFLNLVEKKQNR